MYRRGRGNGVGANHGKEKEVEGEKNNACNTLGSHFPNKWIDIYSISSELVIGEQVLLLVVAICSTLQKNL